MGNKIREIKFRVYDKISKQKYGAEEFKQHTLKDFELEHYVVLQFTGFKDKNGKEIFEGDLLTDVVETDKGKVNSKQKVFWNEPTGSWHLDNSFNQDKTNSTELWLELHDFEYEILAPVNKNLGLFDVGSTYKCPNICNGMVINCTCNSCGCIW